MKSRLLAAALAVGLLAASTASAVTIGYRPRTGDIWVDTHLSDINRYGHLDNAYFIDDVVNSFGAPRYFVRDLLTVRRWEPADIYYACALAHQLNRPCVDVVRDYGDDRGQGWGVIAQRMGIKPGSEAFHALKGKLGKSDDRYRAHFPHNDVHPAQGGGEHGNQGDHGGGDHGNQGDHGARHDAAPAGGKGKGNAGGGQGKDKGGKGNGKGHGR